MNGKGDVRRPLSISHHKFNDNWDMIFRKEELCEYSGLSSVSSYSTPAPEYIALLTSGLFWELHPTLTGIWNQDKDSWNSSKQLTE